MFEHLSNQTFDVVIIGGGITGASIFRDAALRGIKVALVEARDFASGTSSRSSKLIHGGLRYLKNLGLSLAWESCHERNLHIRLNKRLVRPIPFLMPVYSNKNSIWKLRAGMWLYEAMSGLEKHRFHRLLSREETLNEAPGLPVENLIGGFRYYDAVVTDNRWTVEIVKDGVRAGGTAINYAPVVEVVKTDSKNSGVIIEDSLKRTRLRISCETLVNATGIFADHIRKLDDRNAVPLIRLSKGTHLVFLEEDVPLNITTVFSSPIDGRPLFLVKREGCFLYGTTDDWEDADPFDPAPGKSDVDYLLSSLRRFMPEAQLTRDKVQFVYSGFRPLLGAGAGLRPAPADISREDFIEVSPSGMISIVGGKLTTSRLMAIRVLDLIRERIKPTHPWRECMTGKLSIGGTNEAVAEGLSYWVRQYSKLTAYFRILFQRYGLDAHEICSEAMKIHQKKHPDPAAEPIRAEVQYVCNHEMVCTVEDLIDRRAGFLFWNIERRLERLRYGAKVIQNDLGISSEEFEQQYNDYQARLQRIHTLPE